MFRGKFTALNSHIRKEQISKIRNLTLYFRKLEKKRKLNTK